MKGRRAVIIMALLAIVAVVCLLRFGGGPGYPAAEDPESADHMDVDDDADPPPDELPPIIPDDAVDRLSTFAWPVEPEYVPLVHDSFLVRSGARFIGDYPHNNGQMRLRHYVYITGRGHYGFDITARPDSPVKASAAGKVVSRGYSRSDASDTSDYGNFITIEHTGLMGYYDEYGEYQEYKVYTVYAHLNSIEVKKGAEVGKGDTIGVSGNTGGSRIPHVHFEIRIGANKSANTVDPLEVLPERDFSQMKANLTLEDGFKQSSINLYDSIMNEGWNFAVKVRAVRDIVVDRDSDVVIPEGAELNLIKRKGDAVTVEYNQRHIQCKEKDFEFTY